MPRLPPYRHELRHVVKPLVDAFTADRERADHRRFESVLDAIAAGIQDDQWSVQTIEQQYCTVVSKCRENPQEVTDAEIAEAIGAATIGTYTDILGIFYQLTGRSSDYFDQFFTPPNVAEGTATMAVAARDEFDRPEIDTETVTGQSSFDVFAENDDRTGGTSTSECSVLSCMDRTDGDETVIFDPACGSGRLLLAGARVTTGTVALGWDAAYTAARMAALTLALTQTPGWVVQGDSTTLEANTVWRIAPETSSTLESVTVSETPAFPTEHSTTPDSISDVPRLSAEVTGSSTVVEEIRDVLAHGVDLTVGNPPFGDAVISDGGGVVDRGRFALAQKSVGDRSSGTRSSVGYEWLMFELAADLTRPTGAVCFVVPMSALAAPSEKQQRGWLTDEMYLTASVELPAPTFAPETNTRTGMLTAVPRTTSEQGLMLDYQVYMAQADVMGHDARAAPISMTRDDGEVTVPVCETSRSYAAHRWLGKDLVVVPDDDLPVIVARYLDFDSVTEGEGKPVNPG